MRVICYKEKQCEKCGKQFIPKSSTQRWCNECLIKKCVICGNPFSIGKKTKIDSAKFCSRKCKGVFNSKHRTGSNAFHYKTGNRCERVEVECAYCKQIFLIEKGLVNRNLNHFCKNKCYAEYQKEFGPRGKEHRCYSKIETTCEWCGKIFLSIPSTISKVRFCGKSCRNNWQSDMMKGAKHYNWKGGIANWRSIVMASREYKEWRYKVFKRDAYTCQLCGDNKGGNLRAHHIKEAAQYPELIYIVENGITYCDDCHKKVHYG